MVGWTMGKSNLPANSGKGALEGAAPRLLGGGVAVIVLIQVIKWLPLGFLGSWVNSLLWPLALLAILGGAGLYFLRTRS